MNFLTVPTRRPRKAATGGRRPWPMRDEGSRDYGMTLFELLVVLTILAILSTVAVLSTETVLRQGRFEATQGTLQAIEEAILGPPPYQSEDGSVATAGFVADIGRLPRELSELWERGQPPDDLPEFGYWVVNDEGEPDKNGDVVLSSGWRGPYLRLPFGATGLRDGWGKEFEFILDFDPPESEDGLVERFIVRSDGPDGPPGDPDAIPQELVIVDQTEGIGLAHATIQVTVEQQGENGGLEVPSGKIMVRLFGREKDGELFSELNNDHQGQPPTFVFDHVAIGPHVIRAYVKENGEWQPRSAPLSIEVHPLRSTGWKLVLPPDPAGDAGAGTNNGDENDDNTEEY